MRRKRTTDERPMAATSLKKTLVNKGLDDAMNRKIDIPMSSEMVDWLFDTVEQRDADGYLAEEVTSVMAQPLDAMSTFCPLGAIVVSQFTASKLPSLKTATVSSALLVSENACDYNDAEEISQPETVVTIVQGQSNPSHSTIASMGQSIKKASLATTSVMSDAVSRLNVMWLQRKASLLREEGDLEGAFDTLTEAIDAHLGTKDYTNANLSDQVTSDPIELLDNIQQNFFLYDKAAHLTAARIQRFYHRHYMLRCKAAALLSKFYRGYCVRRNFWNTNNRRLQCAKIIQRRFRIHLIRMHALATMIKRFYRMRKLAKEYQWRLFFYRMARRIQRLFRGNMGRLKASKKKDQLLKGMKIQFNVRGFVSRRERGHAVQMYHRMFFKAARRIQKCVRRIQAIHRAQLQLLKELAREEARYNTEREALNEAVKLEIARTKLYLRSDAGRMHFNDILAYIKARDKRFDKIKPDLSKSDIMANDAIISFELFDVDGSGRIDEEELGNMLRELCIPLSKRGVQLLASEIDKDGSGDIDFNEFLDWYCGGADDDDGSNPSGNESSNIGDGVFKRLLQARRLAMEVSGVVMLKRSEREVLRQCTSWLSKDIVSSFRLKHAPKFQCCQCLQPFVLFTDYYSHFDNDGFCVVLNQKAMFYKTYWSHQDWTKQRQVEHEIMRYNNEDPYVRYHILKASYEDLALQRDRGVKRLLKKRMKSAFAMFQKQLKSEAHQHRENASLAEKIMNVVNFHKDSVASKFAVMYLAKAMGVRIPNDWICDNKYDFLEVSDWVYELVDDKRIFDPWFCNMTESGRIAHTASILSKVHIRILRQLQIEVEANLVAISEFRARRVRKITIPDDELISKGLAHLTDKNFNDIRHGVASKLVNVTNAMKDVLFTDLRSCSQCIASLFTIPGVKVSPKSKTEIYNEAFTEEANIVAKAKFNFKLKTTLGSYLVKRFSHETWAVRQRLSKDAHLRVMMGKRRSTGLLFQAEQYTTFGISPGIDVDDMASFMSSQSLGLTDVALKTMIMQLDPDKTGFISLENWITWSDENMSWKNLSPLWLAINGALAALRATTATTYRHYGSKFLLILMKKISRTELACRNLFVQSLLADALPEELRRSPPEGLKENVGTSVGADANDGEVLQTTDEEKNRPEDPPLDAEYIRQSIEKLQVHLQSLRQYQEQIEFKMFCQILEDEAAKETTMQLASIQGARVVDMENRLLRARDNFLAAYGFIIPPGARYPWWVTAIKRYRAALVATSSFIQNLFSRSPIVAHSPLSSVHEQGPDAGGDESLAAWKLAVAIAVSMFDTDGAGDFDEREIQYLLRSTFCGISVRKMLFIFPVLRQNPSITLSEVVEYLLPRITFGRGLMLRLGWKGRLRVLQWPKSAVSVMSFLSMKRQLAKAGVIEATKHTSQNKPGNEGNIRDFQTRSFRVQILATRQMTLFLKTRFGGLQRRLHRPKIKSWWSEHVKATKYSQDGLIKYAFKIHTDDPARGMLVTELPHLVEFLVSRFGFKTTKYIAMMANKLLSVRFASDLVFLSVDDVVELLFGNQCLASWPQQPASKVGNAVNWLLVQTKANVSLDIDHHLYSKARQQAVQIGLQSTEANVAETNYRCSILGMVATRAEKLRTVPWGFLKKRPKVAINWKRAPREAITMLLLARGYSLNDLQTAEVAAYAEILHNDGAISATQVPIKEATAAAYSSIQKKPFFRRHFGRATRSLYHFVPFSWEYFRSARTLKLFPDEVNSAGAEFMLELVTGVSHVKNFG